MAKELDIAPNKLEDLFKKVYSNNTYENIELYDYVLRLKTEGYKIAILSNQFHLSKSTLVPDKYYDNFDALVISSDDKKRKPDENAFELILQKLDIKTRGVYICRW